VHAKNKKFEKIFYNLFRIQTQMLVQLVAPEYHTTYVANKSYESELFIDQNDLKKDLL